MKKLFLAVICAAAVFALRSETLEINGKFENVNKKTGRPANWNLNSWVHYKPAPKIEVTAAEGESAVLHMSDIKGKRGAELFCATPIPAAAGDTVTITAQIKGKGKLSFGLQLRDEKNNYLGYTKTGGTVNIPADWQDVKVTLKTVNARKGPTKKILITFAANNGNELFIRNLAAEKSSAAPAAAENK